MQRISSKILILIIFINFSSYAQTEDTHIYVIKNYWHTGIIIQVDSTTKNDIRALQYFDNFDFVDIGFGDRVFYLHPSNDYVLAARAILVPTESTIRVAKTYNMEDELIRWSDYVLKIRMDSQSILKLCEFIDKSFSKDNQEILRIIEKRLNGNIIFFEANPKYHLFNTCNTWVADALKFSGLENINPSNVVTSKDLFEELLLYAEILKFDETDSMF
ncbi:MAG: DUF2459 domain-containing protein [Melioribacteraceae bacterium]|jgi:uncharacterized protein (TIGR02117 family)|nr:DUF2459 domain-containing protein [Melioribacteraceae bacterium]RJP62811.1 MAG: DUF2459 domain-containing protein [Ignavibacteriales bacterium]WKZ68662.1 MAG: DUF2459 domain-containing protein [Melioribacteraceae bacterium]